MNNTSNRDENHFSPDSIERVSRVLRKPALERHAPIERLGSNRNETNMAKWRQNIGQTERVGSKLDQK